LEDSGTRRNQVARESQTYANTDRGFHEKFPGDLVQESKHGDPDGIPFVKLKDMFAGTRWKLIGIFCVITCAGLMSTSNRGSAASQAGKTRAKPEENTLSHEIRHQLQVLPYYSVFDYISFTLEDHKVTLTGYVLRPHLRNDAERAIGSIEGVSSVSNFIQVLPKSSSDDDLRRAVYRAIFEDSVLQHYAVSDVPSIHVIVKEGTVTLEGSVENENDGKLGAARAASVSGVSSVNNNLMVHAKGVPAG
jgi:hyperosmotically inducible protein